MPFMAFNERYQEHFGRQCKASHYGFDKLTDLFEAMPSTLRILYPPDGEWLIELAECSNGTNVENNVVIDVDDEDDGAAWKVVMAKETTNTAPPPPFATIPKHSPSEAFTTVDRPSQSLQDSTLVVVGGTKAKPPKVEAFENENKSAENKSSEVVEEKEETEQIQIEVQKQRSAVFKAFKSLDFERLLSCRRVLMAMVMLTYLLMLLTHY